MKKSLKQAIAVAATAGFLVVATAGPANATGGAPSGSIVDVAVAASGGGTPDTNNNDYDILIQALTATGLVPVLADTSAKYTVFAPNDRAFLRLVTDLTGVAPASEAEALTTITTALTVEQITNVLLYHVVSNKVLGPVQVIVAGHITMTNGEEIRPRFLTLRDGNSDLTDPRLVIRGLNIKASNGVIHTIDRVLIPASL